MCHHCVYTCAKKYHVIAWLLKACRLCLPPLAPRQDLWLEQVDAQTVAEGEEVTLMAWGNAIVRKVHKDAEGAVTAIDAGG